MYHTVTGMEEVLYTVTGMEEVLYTARYYPALYTPPLYTASRTPCPVYTLQYWSVSRPDHRLERKSTLRAGLFATLIFFSLRSGFVRDGRKGAEKANGTVTKSTLAQ